MSTPSRIVIVGGGLAGARTAETLRECGFEGQVVLLSDESVRPYDRPPLSKGYLLGSSEREEIFVHLAGFYDEHDIDLRLGTRVAALDPGSHEVVTEAGERIAYDRAVLATGSSPRRLEVPGAELDGVAYLRQLDDCEVIKTAYQSAERVVVIGAGWIGLETAAAARAAGVGVTVIEVAELPLVKVLGPEVARVYADIHAAHGVELRMGSGVAAITGVNGVVNGVDLHGGDHLEANLVIVGVGIRPNTDLAAAAGLTVENGVVVDEHLVSSDPDIYAVGDVASAYYPLLGRYLRLEHWAAALNQPAVAAANLTGQPAVYDKVPYFYSDQYDVGMEYTGYVDGYDRVVFRGDVAATEFIAFWMRGQRVLAGMNVNVWDVAEDIESLVRSGAPVDTAKLADPAVPLSEVRAS